MRETGTAAAAERVTDTVEQSRAFCWLVRAGFVARGITYAVIGVVALAVALGLGGIGASPDQQGALSLIGRTALGRVALVVICAGLLAYAVWKLVQGVRGRGPEGGGGSGLKDRVANLAGCGVYVGFFVVALRVLIGAGGNSSAAQRRATAGVLGWPGGRLIVGIAGAALVAISIYQLSDALRGQFAKDSKTQQMGQTERRLFMRIGQIGLTARAIVFALVGYFLVRAAIDFSPSKAIGVDGALAQLHNQRLGPWVLGLVAVGLVMFAVFSLFEARYRRL
jgi:hypothetical protein